MEEKPKASMGDAGYTVVKVGLSAIPILGGPASEIFAAIVTPPLERRRIQWVESIAEAMKKLEEKFESFRIDNLQTNEQFITVVAHASRSAIRNHQREKLEALKSAVLNAALKNEPDEDLQLIFLNYIDDLTPWHLRILSFFKNPNEWFTKNNIKKPILEFGAPAQALDAALPELKKHEGLADQLVMDLNNRGLLTMTSLKTTMTGHGIFETRTTDMGNRFLRFITSPLK